MKTSRRDFLKLAGKATVAAATAGATVKAGAEVPALEPTEVPDGYVAYKGVVVSSVVDDVSPSTVVTNGEIRTSDLAMTHFSKSMVADVGVDVFGERMPTPIKGNAEFNIDAYIEDNSVWGIYNGTPLILIVDHKGAPQDVRGEYKVVATDVDISSGVGMDATVSMQFKEVH